MPTTPNRILVLLLQAKSPPHMTGYLLLSTDAVQGGHELAAMHSFMMQLVDDRRYLIYCSKPPSCCQVLNIALEVASQEGLKSTTAGEQGSAGTASLAFVDSADITGHMQTIADRAEQVSAQATESQ